MSIAPLDADPPLATWPTSGQVVIVDLEYTAWEGSLARGWSEPYEHREVIQIGAVRLDAKTFTVLGSFDVLVRPKQNPTLSDYIVRLTRITDAMLHDHGVAFPEALARFVAFSGLDIPLLANGSDGAVLRENCAIHCVPEVFAVGRVLNIRPALARATGLGADELVSCELPALLGIGPPPERHSALLDANAIATALAELRRRGAI